MVWICLLCQASQKMKGDIEIDEGLIAAVLQVSAKKVVATLEELRKMALISMTSDERNVDVTQTSHREGLLRTTTNVTNDTNVTNGTDSSAAALDKSSTSITTKSGVIFPQKTYYRWIELYGDKGWIDREIKKAVGWYDDQPQKSPKSTRGWCQAVSSWLERSWERSRKSNLRQSSDPKTFSEIKTEKNAELHRRATDGEIFQD